MSLLNARLLSKRIAAVSILSLLLLSVFALPILAQTPAPPQNEAGYPDNLFFGEVPPEGKAPVVVFVHGLRGVASDWFEDNSAYALAYAAGYRTAFVSLSPDNTRNDASIQDNAQVLRSLLPQIASFYGTPDLYIVAHSKGGVDVQASLLDPTMTDLDPAITGLVRAVFMIATPNQGTELADWAFGEGQDIAADLGLLTPGVASMQIAEMALFRAQADPLLEASGVRFFTMGGSVFVGHPLTAITGPILTALSGNVENDGLVTVESAHLYSGFSQDLGKVAANHFWNDQGHLHFGRIHFQIAAMESPIASNFNLKAPDGFGDSNNTWLWSMEWFKGKLYVGTGRAVNCVTFATSDVQQGTSLYPPQISECPPDYHDLDLAAEIWRYTPETDNWERVFQSPENIPVAFDEANNPTKYTARDIGIRGIVSFTEPGGKEVLYAAGVSASSIFEKTPFYDVQGFPPPRILRSEDGVNWTPIPQDAGTFLGDIVQNSPSQLRVRGFRSLQAFDGKLFATASDFRGVGFAIVSDNPAAGNDAWQQASPSALDFPIWTLKTFNGYLYATTGDSENPVGYGVYKTDAQGSPPYNWLPIVTHGAFRPDGLKSPNGLSLWEFKGKLYVGTNRPIEMIRIDRDDHWEVVVGEPRITPQGIKAPLSGLGNGFANFFNGHFWRMVSHDDRLFVGTWNWSVNLGRYFNRPSAISLIPPTGFDFYNTPDGVHWKFLSRNGFNDSINYGVRSLKSTPFGIFMGSARLTGGAPLYQDSSILDYDKDGDIDMNDVNVLMAVRNQPADGEEDPRDIDRDGMITALDARKLMLMCTEPRCAIVNSTPEVPTPQNLESVSVFVNPNKVTLSWEPSPGAVKYHIYRSTVRPALDYFLPTMEVTIPGTDQTITVQEIIDGALDELCSGDSPTVSDCSVIQALRFNLGLAEQFKWIGETTELFFEEPVPTGMQSIYFVQAEDSEGKLSNASSIAGGPSKSTPETLSSVGQRVLSLVSRGRISGDYGDSLLLLLAQAQAAIEGSDIETALALSGQIETSIGDASETTLIEEEVSQELLVHAKRLTRNIWLISKGALPVPAIF